MKHVDASISESDAYVGSEPRSIESLIESILNQGYPFSVACYGLPKVTLVAASGRRHEFTGGTWREAFWKAEAFAYEERRRVQRFVVSAVEKLRGNEGKVQIGRTFLELAEAAVAIQRAALEHKRDPQSMLFPCTNVELDRIGQNVNPDSAFNPEHFMGMRIVVVPA
jgi:hypothetical protein